MISIIIPVYNVARYLDECVKSVVEQAYQDWECILVDDGSNDGSSEICDEWVKRKERMRVIHQKNGGVSRARNRGIEEAKGEYVVFVDSDDWLGKEHLSKLMGAPVADLVVAGIRQYRIDSTHDDAKPSATQTITLTQDFLSQFVDLNDKYLLYGPVAKLYKTSIIKEYDIRFPVDCSYGEDLQFNLNYLNYVQTITQVDDISYYYRRGSGTLSTKTRPNQFEQDYEQWQLLKLFYVNHGLWLQPSKELLYKRLWGIVYDGLFSTSTSKKKILSIPEIEELRKYQHVFHCSKWIKWCVLQRISFVFR